MVWHHSRSFLLSLTLCLLCFVPDSLLMTTTEVSVPITGQDKCDLMQSLHHSLSLLRYNVYINFDEEEGECPSEQRGFKCGLEMRWKNPIDALGAKICIDLQGVAATISNSQFAVIVSDEKGEFQRVYIKSRRFDKPPGNIQCPARSNQVIKVVLRALSTVRMCPDILPSLVNHNTSLGMILVRQEIPTRSLDMTECQFDNHQIFEGHSILKVFLSRSAYAAPCSVPLKSRVRYPHTEACLSIEYLSGDLRCSVQILVNHHEERMLTFDVPNTWHSVLVNKPAHCFKYVNAVAFTEYPALIIRSDLWDCYGSFALGITFKDISVDEDEDTEEHGMNTRNLYMAVFISVVSVCVFIMSITCVCCLRMRRQQRFREAARARRTQAASAAANMGYNDESAYRSSQAFWTSSSSDQVFGLPSYEEATSGAVENPSVTDGPPYDLEADKPPAYENLYSEGGPPPAPPPHTEESQILDPPLPPQSNSVVSNG